jgi:hypothetical protein
MQPLLIWPAAGIRLQQFYFDFATFVHASTKMMMASVLAIKVTYQLFVRVCHYRMLVPAFNNRFFLICCITICVLYAVAQLCH